MIVAASGTLTYEGPSGVSGIIESIVSMESRRRFTQEGDPEDLMQEMRLAAIRALPRFDPDRIGPSPFRYLQQCVRNHLYNLGRGVHVPNNPPCVRCPYWDRQNKVCVVNEMPDDKPCEPIIKYRQNMKLKAALRNPDHLVESDRVSTRPDGSDIDSFLLDQSIRSKLSKELLADYEKLLEGQYIDPRQKTKIRRAVREIMEAD